MSKMIIYIHGFGGSGEGVKAKLFKEAFRDENVIAPSLSYVPDLAILTLCELIESFLKVGENVSLLGSSLGGYYALYLSNKYNLKAVLLNPSVYPYKTLAAYVGVAPNFYYESHFTWTNLHVNSLKEYEVTQVKTELIFLLQQKGDTLLNYTEAEQKLLGCQAVLDEGGSHSFENIELHFKAIAQFLLVTL